MYGHLCFRAKKVRNFAFALGKDEVGGSNPPSSSKEKSWF